MAIGSFSGSGLGFGLAFTLEDDFTRAAQKIEASMSKLDSSATIMANGVNKALGRMKAGFVAIGAGIAAIAPVKFGMEARQEFEQYELQLTTLLKSADKAREVFRNIAADAAENPLFDTGGMMAANTALISTFKYTAEEARKLTNFIGNAVAAQSGNYDENMKKAAEIVQRVALSGGMNAQMLQKSFNTTGINALQMVAMATGKTTEELKKATITLPMLQAGFEKAAQAGGLYENALENASSGMQGLRAEMEDSIKFFWVEFGTATEAISKKVIKSFSTIVSKITELVKSPLGKFLIQITVLLGGLSIVLGTVMLATGAFRFVVLKLALSMKEAAKETIFNTIALKGYGAGFVAVTKAIAASYAPFVKWAIVLGVVYAIGKKLGIFERLGKIFEGISQALSSWDGNTFKLEGAYAAEMEANGLLETVIALSTWAIRLKEFAKGFLQGFKDAFVEVKNAINTLINLIPGLNVEIGRNTSEIENWGKTGEAMGAIMVGMLTAIGVKYLWLSAMWVVKTGAMINKQLILIATTKSLYLSIGIVVAAVSLAIYAWNNWGVAGKVLAVVLGALTAALIVYKAAAMSAAFASFLANMPLMLTIGLILAVIAVIGLLIYGIVKLVQYIVKHWDDIKEAFSSLLAWFADTGKALYAVGRDFVVGLWNGIKSVWSSFAGWVSKSWNSVVDTIKGAINSVTSFLGFGDVFETSSSISVNNPESGRTSSGDVQTTRMYNAAAAFIPQTAPASAGGNSSESINITLEVDGDTLARTVADRNNINEGRGGTINGR